MQNTRGECLEQDVFSAWLQEIAPITAATEDNMAKFERKVDHMAESFAKHEPQDSTEDATTEQELCNSVGDPICPDCGEIIVPTEATLRDATIPVWYCPTCGWLASVPKV